MKRIIYFIILFVSIFALSNSINAWSKYEVGNKVTYKGIDFYVIKDYSTSEENVTLLKSEPLTLDEVIQYKTEANIDVSSTTGKSSAVDVNGYGGMDFGSNSTYSTSKIKKVVDLWNNDRVGNEISEARLITLNELVDNFGYEYDDSNPTSKRYNKTATTPSWVYNSNYSYWTMSQYNDSASSVWRVINDGSLYDANVSPTYSFDVVRPVIIISKSVLGDINDQEDIDKEDKSNASNNNSNKESKVSVNVPNTMQKVSIILIMVGVLLLSISIFLVIKNKRVIKNK